MQTRDTSERINKPWRASARVRCASSQGATGASARTTASLHVSARQAWLDNSFTAQPYERSWVSIPKVPSDEYE